MNSPEIAYRRDVLRAKQVRAFRRLKVMSTCQSPEKYKALKAEYLAICGELDALELGK